MPSHTDDPTTLNKAREYLVPTLGGAPLYEPDEELVELRQILTLKEKLGPLLQASINRFGARTLRMKQKEGSTRQNPTEWIEVGEDLDESKPYIAFKDDDIRAAVVESALAGNLEAIDALLGFLAGDCQVQMTNMRVRMPFLKKIILLDDTARYTIWLSKGQLDRNIAQKLLNESLSPFEAQSLSDSEYYKSYNVAQQNRGFHIYEHEQLRHECREIEGVRDRLRQFFPFQTANLMTDNFDSTEIRTNFPWEKLLERAKNVDDKVKAAFQTLGLEPTATEEEVKQKFRSRAKNSHSDVAGENANARAFQDAKEACDIAIGYLRSKIVVSN